MQQPSPDPYIETIEDHDLPALEPPVPAVTERGRAKLEETPKYPIYERPGPPARRRNHLKQGATQDAVTEIQEDEEQQQTLRLF